MKFGTKLVHLSDVSMGKSPYSDHVFVQTSSDMEDVHGILNGDRTSNLGAPTLSLSFYRPSYHSLPGLVLSSNCHVSHRLSFSSN